MSYKLVHHEWKEGEEKNIEFVKLTLDKLLLFFHALEKYNQIFVMLLFLVYT